MQNRLIFKVLMVIGVVFSAFSIPQLDYIISSLPSKARSSFNEYSRWDELRNLKTSPDPIILERMGKILSENLSVYDTNCILKKNQIFDEIRDEKHFIYGKTLVYISHCFDNEIPQTLFMRMNTRISLLEANVFSTSANESVYRMIDNGLKFVEFFGEIDLLEFVRKLDLHSKLLRYAFFFTNSISPDFKNFEASRVQIKRQIKQYISKESEFYENLKESKDLIHEFEELELLIFEEVLNLKLCNSFTIHKVFRKIRLFLKLALLNENESLKKLMIELGLHICSEISKENESPDSELENLEIVKKVLIKKFGENMNTRKMYDSYILLKTAFSLISKERGAWMIRIFLDNEILDSLEEYLNLPKLNIRKLRAEVQSKSNSCIRLSKKSKKQNISNSSEKYFFSNNESPNASGSDSYLNDIIELNGKDIIDLNQKYSSVTLNFDYNDQFSAQPCSSGLNINNGGINSQQVGNFNENIYLSKAFKRKANELFESQDTDCTSENGVTEPLPKKGVVLSPFDLEISDQLINSKNTPGNYSNISIEQITNENILDFSEPNESNVSFEQIIDDNLFKLPEPNEINNFDVPVEQFMDNNIFELSEPNETDESVILEKTGIASIEKADWEAKEFLNSIYELFSDVNSNIKNQTSDDFENPIQTIFISENVKRLYYPESDQH